MRRRALLVALGTLLAWTAWAAPGAPLTLSCSASPTQGSPPFTVRFTCRANTAPASYRWDFGDGTGASGQNAEHVYRRIGIFTARVQVRAGGKSATWSQVVRSALRSTVTVAPEGGGAEVRFQALKGQRVRITLRAEDPSLEPYGHLESASGAHYYPPNEGARGGVNTWEGELPDTGSYVLTVFDGSNRGGRVGVTVEQVP